MSQVAFGGDLAFLLEVGGYSMKFILVLLGILIIYFIVKAVAKNTSNVATQSKKPKKLISDNFGWLKERWDRVDKEKESGVLNIVESWYFDDATEKQLAYIKKLGINIGNIKLTKGKASDIIGLHEKPEEGSIEILKFFKIPTKGMSQTKARDEVAKIFADSKKAKLWNERPATQMQKEFFRFYNLKITKGLTSTAASKLINDYQMKHEEDEDKLDEWYDYEALFEDINDIDTRRDYEIKKVSLALYRQAIKKLKDEGRSLSELIGDMDAVIEKIIEVKPDIKKV
jgi:hypothetical protein